LQRLARRLTLPWFQVRSARMVLAIAAGQRTQAVALQMQCAVDTVRRTLHTFNKLAERYGFRPVENAVAARTLTTLDFLKEHKIPLSKLPAVIREFRLTQRGQMEAVRLFPGLLDTLQAIHQKGCHLGVLSSNAKENILACLRANRGADLFDFVVGYTRLFGKARAIRRILKTKVMKPDELLYVGDETRDIEAARTAGVDVAAVTWGFHAEEVLAGNSPTYLIREAAEIVALVR
jgi:phosphoglycolate phosphatase